MTESDPDEMYCCCRYFVSSPRQPGAIKAEEQEPQPGQKEGAVKEPVSRDLSD